MNENRKPHTVVAIPCYNEEITIGKVVSDFRTELPDARICVFDNNSTDASVERAEKEGAEIFRVPLQGKGHVMRTIFDNIVSDVLIVVDGDNTYSASDAKMLVKPVLEGKADMAVGNRIVNATPASIKPLHIFGNIAIVKIINLLFNTHYVDILSGYRVFNRNFVENVPMLTSGFETETEMTVRALIEKMKIMEVPIQYKARPEGSSSKLSSFSDGYRIILTAIILMRDLQPLRLFGTVSLLCAAGAAVFAFRHELSAAGVLVLLSALFLVTGLMLNAINVRFHEFRQIERRSRHSTK